MPSSICSAVSIMISSRMRTVRSPSSSMTKTNRISRILSSFLIGWRAVICSSDTADCASAFSSTTHPTNKCSLSPLVLQAHRWSMKRAFMKRKRPIWRQSMNSSEIMYRATSNTGKSEMISASKK